MHAARLEMEAGNPKPPASALNTSVFVGCSGWFYWKWRGSFYPASLPTSEWFSITQSASTPSNSTYPTIRGRPWRNVKAWKREPKKRNFVYTVKVCELITRIKKFKSTKTLVKDFGMIADSRRYIPPSAWPRAVVSAQLFRMNSKNGPYGSRPAVQNELGFTSTTTTKRCSAKRQHYASLARIYLNKTP